MKCFLIILCIMLSSSCVAQETLVLVPYELNGKTGFVNGQLKKVTEPVFKFMINFNNTGYVQAKKLDGSNVIIGPDGKEIAFDFNSGILNDDYWYTTSGIWDKTEYSTINSFADGSHIRIPYIILSGSKNSIIVSVPEARPPSTRTYANYKGELLFPNRLFSNRSQNFDESGSVAVVSDENFEMRLVNKKGEFTSRPNLSILFYDYFIEGLCFGIHGKESGFYDMNANLKISIATIEPVNDETIGFVPAFYNSVLPVVLRNNKMFIKTSWMETGKNLTWRLINTKGEFVGSEIVADFVSEFKGGFGQVSRKKKWAYIKPDGTFLTDFVFDSVKEFVHGYGRIQINKRDGLVDSNGKIFWCDEFR